MERLNDKATKTCDICDKKIKLGEFAFEQKICWECFVEAIWRIRARAYPEDQKYIKFALDVLAEIYHRDGSYKFNFEMGN